MTFLRSLAFHLCFFIWTAFWLVGMIPLFFIPRWLMIRGIILFFSSYIPFERYIAGIDFEVRGRENLPAGPCLIAMKHQSAYETFKLHYIFGDVAVILKRSLMFVPLWGWYQAKSGVIPVDRGAGGRAMVSLLTGARKIAAQKRSIVIFPQGTRVPPGAKRSYKSGVSVLYEDLNWPVVPVALNSGVFWPRRAFFLKPGRVVFDILPAIPPGLGREEMQKRMEEAIETASDRLLAESSGVSARRA